MMDLAQHIERLLIDNDCVIVPQLGGFITYYGPARWVEQEGLFLPPGRMTGFNPRLTLNDGLLVQSFMAERHVRFAEASQMVKQEVDKLINVLHTEGSAELPRIGRLHLSLHNTFDFTPYQPVTSAELYGYTSFRMKKLGALHETPEPAPLPSAPQAEEAGAQPRLRIHLNGSFWSNAAAVAAIIILFFAISIPVKNTETIHGNYAQLLPTEMFEKMGIQALPTTPLSLREAPTQPVAQPTRPVAQETVQPASTPEPTPQPAPPSAPQAKPAPVAKAAPPLTYHLIVASVGSEADAQKMAEELVRKGHKRARAIIGGGKMRVSIDSFASETEAYQAVNRLRQEEAYKNAWVLKKK